MRVIYEYGWKDEYEREFQEYYASRLSDLRMYKRKVYGDKSEEVERFIEEHGPFEDYPLDITIGTVEELAPWLLEHEDYVISDDPCILYQISTGGPGDEFVFVWPLHHDPRYRAYYRFLPWFAGKAIDVTDVEIVDWLFAWLRGADYVEEAEVKVRCRRSRHNLSI